MSQMPANRMGESWQWSGAFLFAISLVVLLCGCRPESSILRGIEHPYWFHVVRAPVIDDEAELQALWLSAPRCCSAESVKNNRIFYKACATAIERHPGDDHLVVKCLWLMQAGLDGRASARLDELIVSRYFDHRDSLRNCANCAPGDTVSRVSKDLALHYAARGDMNAAISLLERVLDARADASPWVRIEGYTQLCKFYLRSELTDAREARIRVAHMAFERLREEETIGRRFAAFDRSCGPIHSTEVETG